MWWPRPRWKCDLFTYCALLLFITITTTSDAVMADEGQHCGGGNMSAVVLTTALCTMLLVLVVVAIYLIYCRRRENDWSSLWWKSNSDKNLVLQTSLPTKDQQLKTGGTDNPAFLADTYIGDRVAKTGLVKIVCLPQSTINSGSLEIELSTKEDNKQMYMYKHSNGSKDRLVALRLVFDKGQQCSSGPPSDLSRAVVELSRKYGLQVELETADGEAVAAQPTAAAEKSGDELTVKCVKPNILSSVRGKAQRLWHQGQAVFKGGDRSVTANNNNSGGDPESAEDGCAATVAATTQKSSCTVTTVDETAAATKNDNGPLRYRTLEYGASPADVAAHSYPDSSVQYCSVNVPEPVAVVSVSAVMSAAVDKDVVTTAPDRDAAAATAPDQATIVTDSGKNAGSTVPIVVLQDVTVTTVPDDDATAAATVTDKYAVVGDDEKVVSKTKTKYVAPPKPTRDEPKYTAPVKPDHGEPKYAAPPKPTRDEPKHPAPGKPDCDEPKPTASVKPNQDEPRHTSSNPPPPPPRKYSASVVPPVVSVPRSIANNTRTTVIATDAAISIAADTCTDPDTLQRSPTVIDAPSPALPTKAPPLTTNEIRMDDDYYWCTTTSMAPPPMSTFGKRPSVMASTADATNRDRDAAVSDGAAAEDGKNVTIDGKSATVDDKYAAAVTADDAMTRDVVNGGTTTSIEDASLPSFSSDEDEDEDDNGHFADSKAKSPANATDAVQLRNNGDGKACNGEEVDISSGRKDNMAVAKADCDVGPAAAESKSPTRLPTLRLSLSSPLSSTAPTSCCSSSASSTSSTSTSSSPTNNGSSNNNSPIVSKIPVRRQSAGSNIGTGVVSSSPTANGTPKKAIPLPLSRSGSRLAMWSSAN